MAIFTFIFFIIVIIFIFSSKKFSPIPYFPTQKADLPLIINVLNLKDNQTVIDLGAGDGIIIFEAAKYSFQKNLNTKFIAVEINPVLILILHLHRLFHLNRKSIKIIYGDIFKLNFNSLTRQPVNNVTMKPFDETQGKQFNNLTIYLYISPWFLEKTISNIKDQIPARPAGGSKFSIVSYMYSIKSLKNSERIIQGKNSIFVYDF